jgi:hypothetical protein
MAWCSELEVRELGSGTSNVRFDYRITAIRRKYETVRFEDHTNDPVPGENAGPDAQSQARVIL